MSNFSGDIAIYGKDPNQGSTTNFYISVKNLILDSTLIKPTTTFTLLDWSVSQACQLTNVVFNMPDYSTGHTGVAMYEGGSPTMINDCTFNGGANGILLNTQQYHLKGLTFNGCNVGINSQFIVDLVVQSCSFTDCGTSILTTDDATYFMAVIDSSATNCGSLVDMPAQTSGQGSVVVENCQVSGTVVSRTEPSPYYLLATLQLTFTDRYRQWRDCGLRKRRAWRGLGLWQFLHGGRSFDWCFPGWYHLQCEPAELPRD